METNCWRHAENVKHHETKRFDIYTDSSAAESKFPKVLEATYVFERAQPGVLELKDRLPI